ncbi:MAG: hypothetical protein K5871_02135 [Lachnospiraceae bacterium]|nr:hypothetical protein [Lachnospiraceae bacterium]
MYKIEEGKEENTILIPATLDDHFPFLRYMFCSKGYFCVPLDEDLEFQIRQEGLKYSNHDICYPYVLMVGQVIRALNSGLYDTSKTFILMPTAGDSCRGACYIGLMKYSLEKAKFPEVRVMTINVRHVRDDIQLKINLDTAIRGLFGLFYGDMLMLLVNQTRPYEVKKGTVNKLRQEWIDRLSEDLKSGKNLTLVKLKKNMQLMAESFRDVEKTDEKKPIVGIVAEFYVKYCSLGNWDVVKYIENNGGEAHVNGASWYGLYYIDSHKPEKFGLERAAFEFVKKLISHYQNVMIDILRSNGFHCLNNYRTLDENSRQHVNHNLKTGDGWLLGAEVVDYINCGINKVLCIAPFGCMANVCAGRGLYPHLQREFPGSNITVVETDSSSSKLNYFNRVEMLLKLGK